MPTKAPAEASGGGAGGVKDMAPKCRSGGEFQARLSWRKEKLLHLRLDLKAKRSPWRASSTWESSKKLWKKLWCGTSSHAKNMPQTCVCGQNSCNVLSIWKLRCVTFGSFPRPALPSLLCSTTQSIWLKLWLPSHFSVCWHILPWRSKEACICSFIELQFLFGSSCCANPVRPHPLQALVAQRCSHNFCQKA